MIVSILIIRAVRKAWQELSEDFTFLFITMYCFWPDIFLNRFANIKYFTFLIVLKKKSVLFEFYVVFIFLLWSFNLIRSDRNCFFI